MKKITDKIRMMCLSPSIILMAMMGVAFCSCEKDEQEYEEAGISYHAAEADPGDEERGSLTYLISPPEGSIMQEWLFKYMDYKDFWYYDSFSYVDNTDHQPEYEIQSESVYIVMNKSDIYVRGLCRDFPDAWIKGSIKGEDIVFPNGQCMIEIEKEGDREYRYFTPCHFKSSYYEGHTFLDIEVYTVPSKSNMNFKYSKKEKTIRSVAPHQIYADTYGFSLSCELDGSMYGKEGYAYSEETGDEEDDIKYVYSSWEFEDADMYVNVWFEKK